MSSLRSTLLEPEDMDDPKYSDEYLTLRAQCFQKLSHQLNHHVRQVYEFASIWVEQGHLDTEGIEEQFEQYLISTLENSYAKSN